MKAKQVRFAIGAWLLVVGITMLGWLAIYLIAGEVSLLSSVILSIGVGFFVGRALALAMNEREKERRKQ